MDKRIMLKIFVVVVAFINFGCAEHKVDTAQEWCEQIGGEDLDEKYRPFWAVIFRVSFDGDAIRDDFTEILNKLHLEKVNNRAPKMAWREGTELHLVNLSSLMVVKPETIIEEWRNGIELSKQYKHTKPANNCLYGSLTSLFDSLHIYTMDSDVFGKEWTEKITVIPTDREKRLGKERL
jgi:hypothetical protein